MGKANMVRYSERARERERESGRVQAAWMEQSYGVVENSDRCSGQQLPINTFMLKIHRGQEWESFVSAFKASSKYSYKHSWDILSVTLGAGKLRRLVFKILKDVEELLLVPMEK